jgi:plasmid maintenance system antidote protein VapI
MIQEELDARGWTVDELAIRMGDNPPRNRLVLDLYMQLGPEKLTMELGRPTAEQLGCAFDVAPELFLNLHDAWRRARLS